MKQSVKVLLLAVLLIAVLCGGYFGYRALLPKLQPDAAATTAAPTEDAPAADTAGERAADFTVFDRDGNPVRLSEKSGKPVVINFWASWCSPCKSELPDFDAAFAERGDAVEFMMVNLTDGVDETEEGVNAFLEENGYTFPVYFDLDQEASAAYGVYSIPMTVFVNADGTVAREEIGALSALQLNNGLDAILNGGTAQ